MPKHFVLVSVLFNFFNKLLAARDTCKLVCRIDALEKSDRFFNSWERVVAGADKLELVDFFNEVAFEFDSVIADFEVVFTCSGSILVGFNAVATCLDLGIVCFHGVVFGFCKEARCFGEEAVFFDTQKVDCLVVDCSVVVVLGNHFKVFGSDLLLNLYKKN